MKKIQLKKKDGTIIGDYVPVHERVLYFRGEDAYKGWVLISENLTPGDPDRAQFKATVINDLGLIVGTGHAEERAGSNFINETSHVENAETSAWGRALGCIGIGIDTGIASLEEVGNAVKQKDDLPWLNDKDFKNACYDMNREADNAKRAEMYTSLKKTFRIAKRYSGQLSEIVNQRDIQV